MFTAYLTRTVAFTATHRVYRADWPDGRNRETFGDAADDHAHHYEVRVTVRGGLAPAAGGVMDLAALDRLLAREVTERLGGRNINETVAEFAPGRWLVTGEALAVHLWDRLATRLPDGVALHAVRVREGPDLYAEYFGEA